MTDHAKEALIALAEAKKLGRGVALSDGDRYLGAVGTALTHAVLASARGEQAQDEELDRTVPAGFVRRGDAVGPTETK